MENGIQYEVINKVTGESFLAKQVAFGDGEVTVSTDAGDVVFKNDNGAWSNEQFVARDVETKLAPNGVDVVEDVVVAESAVVTEDGVAPVPTE